VGPRAGLDRCGKSRPPPGFDSRTIQPVAIRYTELPGPNDSQYTVQKHEVNLTCTFRHHHSRDVTPYRLVNREGHSGSIFRAPLTFNMVEHPRRAEA